MSDKQNAIAEVEKAYGEIQEAAGGVPDEKMTAVWFGEWSAKDVLAHIASWDEFTSGDLQRIARGHMPCLAAFREAEVDQWNGFFMRPRRMFTLAQVRFESQHWHDKLVETLSGLPDVLFAPGQMTGNFLAIICGHYRDHARNIREWREKEGM